MLSEQHQLLVTRTKKLCKVARMNRMASIPVLRALVMSWGIIPNPVGVTNKKVKLPATYRPVGGAATDTLLGGTCPPDCPYLGGNGCYAELGHTHLAAKRSGSDLDRSLMAVAIAVAAAAAATAYARLHVSGDFGRDGALDPDYVTGIRLVIETCQKFFSRTDQMAWTYTHFSPEHFEPFRAELAGTVEVMYSDRVEAGGAIVVGPSWEGLAKLRTEYPNLKFAPCPASASNGKINCGSCNHGTPLCLVAREKNIVVVFPAHGSGKKKAQLVAARVNAKSF